MIASTSTRKPESVDELLDPAVASAIDQLDIASRRSFLGKLQGERRSKVRGRSVEFDDHRPYAMGDDLRHIDWSVFARLDRFFVKVFQEEQDLTVHIVLDASASMDAGTPNKLIVAQRLAMALGYVALVSNNRVVASIIGSEPGEPGSGRLLSLPALRGRTGVQRLARFLLESTFPEHARSRPRGGLSPSDRFASDLRGLVAARTGTGVMLLISDLMIPGSGSAAASSGFEAGLRLLSGVQGGGWDVTLLQVLAPGEIDPSSEVNSEGRPLVLGDIRLTDSETGRAAEVTISRELLDRYRERFERYQLALSTFAKSRGMNLLTLPSDTDIAAFVLGDLRARGLIRP